MKHEANKMEIEIIFFKINKFFQLIKMEYETQFYTHKVCVQ